jgi:hypothetical protein
MGQLESIPFQGDRLQTRGLRIDKVDGVWKIVLYAFNTDPV